MDLQQKKDEWLSFITAKPMPPLENSALKHLLNQKEFTDFKRWGFCYRDLSKFDLSNISLEILSQIPFNSSTTWPSRDKMAKGFNPTKILSQRKSPALSIKALHQKGITGKDTKCLVLDQCLHFPLVHDEIKNQNITLSKFSLQHKNWNIHFHGECVLANLCGKNIGVAPESEVEYYYLEPNFEIYYERQTFMSKCFDYQLTVLENILSRLESGEKIDIITLSGTPLNYLDYKPKAEKKIAEKKLFEFYDKIKSFGCEILSAENFYEHFTSGNINCFKNFDDINEIEKPSWRKTTPLNKPCVICGGKVVPEYMSTDGYQYVPETSESWSIPQVSGLFLLARQIDRNITLEEFISLSVSTSQKNKNNLSIFNPEQLIEKIKIKQNTLQKE